MTDRFGHDSDKGGSMGAALVGPNPATGLTQEIEPYRLIAQSVLLQGAKDLRGRDLWNALDAWLWFATGDAGLYLEAVGMETDPLEWLAEEATMSDRQVPRGQNLDVLRCLEGLSTQQVRLMAWFVGLALPAMKEAIVQQFPNQLEATNGRNHQAREGREDRPRNPGI